MAKIAFILESDYEDSEFQQPYDALRKDGHTCVVVGTEKEKKLQGKRGTSRTTVEQSVETAKPGDFDALVIPGGYSPDKLRVHEAAVAFTRRFVTSGRPVASICHGPQLLIEAGVVEGRRITSWPSVRTDLRNAGASWVDEEVAQDGNLISSRKPEDVPAFIDAIRQSLAARV